MHFSIRLDELIGNLMEAYCCCSAPDVCSLQEFAHVGVPNVLDLAAARKSKARGFNPDDS